jgi:hypothetical protein
LSLDHDERDVLVRHLDGVSVPELMWCEPTPDAGLGGRVMRCLRAADASQRRAAKLARAKVDGPDLRADVRSLGLFDHKLA